jgi:hypothetical protein
MPANISNNIVFKVCRNGTNRLFLLYERKYNINDRRMKYGAQNETYIED